MSLSHLRLRLLAPVLLVLCALSGVFSALADDTARPATVALEQAAPAAPTAKIEPHVTELHGDTRVDNYFWLRERESDEVIAYLEAENAYTEAMTSHTEALQGKLYDELLGRIQETDLSVPSRKGDYFYYTRTEEGKQYPIYCRKKGSLEADEEVLLDANAMAEGKEYFRVGIYQVSPNHRLLAYSEDVDGSELYTLRVKDLASGETLADAIPGVAYAFAWGNDDKTFFYTMRDAARRPHKVLRHVLGTEASADAEIFREDDERFSVFVGKTLDERFLLLGSSSAITSEIHVLDADTPGGDFQVFRERVQGVEYTLDHHGEHFYIRTNEDAKNYKLLRTPDDAFAPEHWQEVIPHRPQIELEQVVYFKRHMVIVERDGGVRRMKVRDLENGEERRVDMPESVYAVFPAENPEFDTTRFRFTYMSPITPRSVYEYDMVGHGLELLKETPVLGYDRTRYETQRIYVRARDGVAVPLIVTYKKGFERSGENPCLLYAYGSYGVTMDPFFSPHVFSLLDRGFVFALAQIRGGGALGETWHDDGKMMSKKNTFTDFIDAAEYLIDQRYTGSDRLVIQGGSAGGLLMGAVLNMRPDLFRAAVAQVPFVDVINTMLDESIPLTVGEFEEWGNPKVEEHYRYMLSYSPYDNVEAISYPEILITAGLNDPRVQYWEPAKWTAKLRAMKTDSNRLLLKTNMGAGHGGASGRYDALRERAFVYAFMLDSVGITD